MELCPSISSANLSASKDDRMKNNVVLSNELIELDIVGISPPELPVIGVASGN